MDDQQTRLPDRQRLFAACSQEAERLGGDERCAEYFFVRAQSSRVQYGAKGAVTVADMKIEDWCDAIAWSAPGMGKPPNRASSRSSASDTETGHPQLEARKQPRSGAKSKRASGDFA